LVIDNIVLSCSADITTNSVSICFQIAECRAKIVAQSKVASTPAQLQLAVMGAICGVKDVQPNSILHFDL